MKNMNEITLVFSDQLFLNHPALSPGRVIYLVEEFLFFKVQHFHKQRLFLLKAATRSYAEALTQAGNTVVYLSSKDINERGEVFTLISKKNIKSIHLAEFADEWLQQDLMTAAQKYGWDLHFYPSPGFICSNKELEDFFSKKTHFSMAPFYACQRKSLNILMDKTKPIGGKYSFDSENRRKIPKGLSIPPYISPKITLYDQLKDEIEREFPNAIGKLNVPYYPINHKEAEEQLFDFLNHKLMQFGEYQDAIQTNDSFLFHSVLSPLLNCGLLTPLQVIEATLKHAKTHSIPLNSLEGFLRQIMGWREFVRASYMFKGSEQRSSNCFHHYQKIPGKFWKGTTGIPPIDSLVKRILETGYCNHIERLMVLGNFLLLTESDPNEVYIWFMGNFVDAYDWVMVPNIYGMSQYADNGKIVTKPYISGSNYLLKMSDYKKGDWTDIWDGLFWRFIDKHRTKLASNPRMQILIQLLSKNAETISPKICKAEAWLTNYRQDTSTY